MDELGIGHLSINAITNELRKDSLSIKNRLQSIIHDSFFVASLGSHTDLQHYPLIPNERCGLWYVPNKDQVDTSYFKSTDGHTNQWTFSLRRLNLHLLPLLHQFDGISIIDSTRKGKLIPDALLKTIPTWCAVINCILYENMEDDEVLAELRTFDNFTDEDASFVLNLKHDNWLLTPKQMVSRNEHNQILKRIPEFVREVKKLDLFSDTRLLKDLGVRKPLIPTFYYPGCKKLKINEDLFEFEHINNSESKNIFYSVHCITASKKTTEQGGSRISVRNETGKKLTSWYYVQGSADDHELWATNLVCQGNLQPKFFWNNIYTSEGSINRSIIDPDTKYIHDWLSDDELILRMNKIYDDSITPHSSDKFLDVTSVRNQDSDTGIVFGVIESNTTISNIIKQLPFTKTVILLSELYTIEQDEKKPIKLHHYKVSASKKGAKQMREIFPKLIPQINIEGLSHENTLVILCDSGKDISAGLVVLLLCKYFGMDWKKQNEVLLRPNKDMVKKQLGLLLDVRKINPSRNTLQSVNTYLMA